MPPHRRPSLVSEICAEIVRKYCLNQDKLGTFLPSERILALNLGVSRVIVREATQRLAFQGLLDVKHGVGTKVAKQLHRPVNASLELLLPDQTARLRQTMEARIVLEPSVAEMAAARASPEMLRRLKSIHRTLGDATDKQAAVSLDLEFHSIIAQASGNLVMLLILDSIAELGRQSRLLTMPRFELKRTCAQHEHILNAIIAHNPSGAAEAMRQHLDFAAMDLGVLLAELESRPPASP